MSNTLAEICAKKHAHIAQARQRVSLNDLQAQLSQLSAPRGFVNALENAKDGIGVIAEIKKASPSQGLIRADFNPKALATAYQQGGASCLSVLTDTPYFQGSNADFRISRTTSSLPMLRKDFMLEAYQIIESRVLGADCILLILAVLEDDAAQKLLNLTMKLGMDALLEVHDEAELTRAQRLDVPPARCMIGINNRNLKTLAVDPATCLRLATMVQQPWWVAESGIADAATMRQMHQAGARGFLIGESLMRQDDVAAALDGLLQEART